MRSLVILSAIALAFSCIVSMGAEEAVFSGPQVGEKLPPFEVLGVLGPEAGKKLDFVTQAAGKPILLIFVHDMNRQSIGMTRVLSGYAVSRADDALHTGVVFLADDATEIENTVKRIEHALAPQAPTGISLDGREGPGSYGLNRNVTLTILVGNEGQVTGNFALIQPSLQADLPKILQSVVAVAGGQVPKLEALQGMPEMMRKSADGGQVVDLRPLLAPLIRADATPQQVDQAAVVVEAVAEKQPAARKEIGQVANRIIDAGKLANYGTPRAQEYIEKWAKAYGKDAEVKNEAARRSGERR